MNKMDMPYVVGVDVGGQTTKIGVVDMRGQVLAQTVIRTDTHDEVEPYIDRTRRSYRQGDCRCWRYRTGPRYRNGYS